MTRASKKREEKTWKAVEKDMRNKKTRYGPTTPAAPKQQAPAAKLQIAPKKRKKK